MTTEETMLKSSETESESVLPLFNNKQVCCVEAPSFLWFLKSKWPENVIIEEEIKSSLESFANAIEEVGETVTEIISEAIDSSESALETEIIELVNIYCLLKLSTRF